MSAKDFYKALGIVLKELGESRYWLRLSVRRQWLQQRSVDNLVDESLHLSRVFGSMVGRGKRRAAGAA